MTHPLIDGFCLTLLYLAPCLLMMQVMDLRTVSANDAAVSRSTIRLRTSKQ